MKISRFDLCFFLIELIESIGVARPPPLQYFFYLKPCNFSIIGLALYI
jgi:hypothetical protein